MFPNQIVLVSGASGFIATHVLDAFLSASYSIQGMVRSVKVADKVLRTYPQYKVKLSFAIVSDIGKPNAIDGCREARRQYHSHNESGPVPGER
ncbi:NAD dependent epimerase/dehydratase [Penicillium chrysogenum]|uniref:NAD dependent epimerase/dehydratase n=1 Tax=Penicillium chrysogenum TaxID=5076 RepID=UPI0024DF0F92|nr:NAD dependent epimerase/dehydratase [Penicillium chrysogenum]KAJ5253159.1 NAD dependent epimerase/dehydratase [Penicillium chrysogenum]